MVVPDHFVPSLSSMGVNSRNAQQPLNHISTSWCRLTGCLLLSLVLSVQLGALEAAIYTNYSAEREVPKDNYYYYPSLELKTTETLEEGQIYEAELYYLEENQQLCNTKFSSASRLPKTNKPVALLAATGRCSVAQKVRVAQRIVPTVKFLILFGPVGESALTTKNPTSSAIQILRVSHQTGHRLIARVRQSPMNEGTPIAMDSVVPSASEKADILILDATTTTTTTTPKKHGELDSFNVSDSLPRRQPHNPSPASSTTPNPHLGLVSNDDYFDLDMVVSENGFSSDMMDPDVNVFYFMVLLSSFFFVCAARSARQRRADRNRDPSLVPISAIENPTFPPEYMGRDTVSPEDIERYLVPVSQTSVFVVETEDPHDHKQDFCLEEDNDPTTYMDRGADVVPLHCAICIEDLDLKYPETTLRLPCEHTFHKECIIPWLTERQGTCPLCKHNVHQYCREASAMDFTLPPEMDYVLSRAKDVVSFLSPLVFLRAYEMLRPENEEEEQLTASTFSTAELEMTESPTMSLSPL